MSDLLIKDMKMPKNCYQCRMVDSCQYLWKPYDLDDYSDLQNMVEEGFTRADNCPLVEIPPHGRLIDADEMYEEFVLEGQRSTRYKLGEMWELNGKEIRRAIYRLPTVIPATEAKEAK